MAQAITKITAIIYNKFSMVVLFYVLKVNLSASLKQILFQKENVETSIWS
jgi:hypothetical protein